ncbi:MAG: PAS domain S-box protein [Flavobacteriia bacterium]
MKKILLIFCVLLSFISEGQLFTFKNINHKNGLSLSSVLSISQDKYGYIWIGTDGFGLQRYDGKTVKSITLDENDNEHHVTSIDATEDGIYFSSQYLGFYHYKDNKLNKIAENHKDFGERFGIKKIGNSILLVGSKKMKLLQKGKLISEISFPNWSGDIVQIQKITGGLLVITENYAFHVTENKIEYLNSWLKQKIKPIACRFFENKIEFFQLNNDSKTVVYLNKTGEIFSKENKKLRSVIATPFKRIASTEKHIFGLTTTNQIYFFKNNSFRFIPKNTSKSNIAFNNVYIDVNNDFWASSSNSGITKISDEPFTKIELDEVYRNPLISFIFKTKGNEIFISTFENKTFYSSYSLPTFSSFDLRIYAKTKFQNEDIFATNKGIYKFNGANFIPIKGTTSKEKIIFIFADEENIYYCPEGKGLFVYSSLTKKTTQLLNPVQASHIYTAQINFNHTGIYFGTNNGIYECVPKTNLIKHISSRFKTKGSYSGVSCVDSHGTIWFTYDKKIIGITKRDEYLVIEDKKYFKSTLFFTLNADPYGNLIIGTNVGITKLKIDYLGNVINHFEYNYNNGFNGYETHMRSCFQDEKLIYVGTIEGMYSINTEKLEYLPNPPMPLIFQLNEKKNPNLNSDEDLIKISFLALNPKLTGIQYTYRLKGKSPYWSELTPKTEAYFSNLSDQEYIFQVRSTYDGLTFSPIASYKIVKNTPFWKTKWFILLLVLSIALANIIVLDRSKSFELSQIIENQDVEISSKIRSIILAFGVIANSGTHYFVSFIEKDLQQYLVLNVIVALILILLFLLSIYKHLFSRLNKYILQIGLFTIVGQCYLLAYFSAIHPIYVVIIALCTALIPFIFNKISQVIIFSIFQLISVISIIFLVENAVYNEILFLIAIIVSVCLSVFTTYIRNESLQKLMFISGIVNKGNIIAIAYNQTNNITYFSENSLTNLNINSSQYLGKNISELNKYIVKSLLNRKIDLATEFKDDQSHILPMKKPDGTIVWMEWACKVFSNKIKVVFGQDITERIKIENNYESLVENAQDLIYYVDVNGVFIFTNTKFKEILDYEESELIGRDAVFIVNELQQQRVRDFYANQFNKQTLNTYNEVLVRKKDGSEIWIGQNTTILYALGSTKIVKGFLCIARDITEKRSQQDLIESQNESITASINYAQKIQSNLLPHEVKTKEIFSEFKAFYKAKDIVSGDFYWLEELENKLIFVLADCTGHGVPGAFMTLLGINLLNQIIIEDKTFEPHLILSKLDEKLNQVLPREGNSSLRDGMEMTVFIYDRVAKRYDFACAGGKFIAKIGPDFEIFRGESKHIGDTPESNFTRYNTYTITQQNVEGFYFFTDGIQDQFSESTAKKFTLKRLLELLNKIPDATINEVVDEVADKHYKWKGSAEQTDDITFIGLKF